MVPKESTAAWAPVYFQRALRVDPAFISAWTLMGHELVELKNTHAAIDAYRHAVGRARVKSPPRPNSHTT